MVWYNPKIRLCSPAEHAEDHESGKDMPKWRVWFALLDAHAPDWSTTLVHLGTETSETNFKAKMQESSPPSERVSN